MEFSEYFSDFSSALNETLAIPENMEGLTQSVEIVKQTRADRTKIILIGNGGSSSIAEHMAIDLTKNAGIRSIIVGGTVQLTTFANDFGFENVYCKGIEAYADKGDVVFAISSGGESKNIISAVESAKKIGCKVITLSGFDKGNSLSKAGDINMYVPSKAYGYVEIIHNLLIHAINDMIIGRAVYKISDFKPGYDE